MYFYLALYVFFTGNLYHAALKDDVSPYIPNCVTFDNSFSTELQI